MPPPSTFQHSFSSSIPHLHPLPLFCGGGSRWGWGARQPRRPRWRLAAGPSLDVAAAAGAPLGVCAVGLRGQGLVERVEAGVRRQGVSPRRHPLVDAVQALGLFEASDLVLRREAFDCCWDAGNKGGGEGRRELAVILYGIEFKWLKEWGWKGWGHAHIHPWITKFDYICFALEIVREKNCFTEKMTTETAPDHLMSCWLVQLHLIHENGISKGDLWYDKCMASISPDTLVGLENRHTCFLGWGHTRRLKKKKNPTH